MKARAAARSQGLWPVAATATTVAKVAGIQQLPQMVGDLGRYLRPIM
jgi:hypothetical protein